MEVGLFCCGGGSILQGGAAMAIKFQYIIAAQIQEMHKHRWIEGVKRRCDPGEGAFLDWVAKYSRMFREWANTVPKECIHCNKNCDCKEDECCHPFDEGRIRYWKDSLKGTSQQK